ncbi:MAG: Tfp pilus assembly protein PilF [Saprospiraceae bacterium]|jgi:Tfp pilus assembly protein PilF
MSKKKTGKPKQVKIANYSEIVGKELRTIERPKLIILGAILALLGFLIYANTLNHEYALDDYSAIKENFVTQRGVSGLGDIFTKSYRYGYWNSKGTLYRPVSLAMFAVEWEIMEDKPGFHHFINVLLYALTAFLLFWTLVKLIPDKSPLLPFLATLLFIAHPLHVEVVANIKSRDEILSFLFCIGAIYCFWKYLKFDHIPWLVAAVFSYLVAMFSKESAITFLAVFPLIGYFFLKKDLPTSFIKSLVFLAPVAIYLFARYQVLGNVFAGAEDIPLLDNVLADAGNKGEQLATAFVFAGKYLKNLFLPQPLGSDFGFPQFTAVGWGDWRALLSFVLFAAMGVYAIMSFKKRSILSFGILYFFITFSIFSNMVIQIGSSYGDRFMYVPSLGFSLVIAYLITHLTKTVYDKKLPGIAAFFSKYMMPLAIVGVIAMAFSAKTILRNAAWKNSYTLYNTDIKTAPNSAKLNYHYGLELNKLAIAAVDPNLKKKYWNDAMFRFQRSLELYPAYADAYGQRGLLFYRLKDFSKAIADYETSLKMKPNAKVYSNMGTVYLESGRATEAIEAYKNAVKYDPRFVDARRNLGSSYANTKQFDKALVEYKTALEYEPKSPILHFYIGMVYKDLGDQVNSKVWLDKAYALDPSLRK